MKLPGKKEKPSEKKEEGNPFPKRLFVIPVLWPHLGGFEAHKRLESVFVSSIDGERQVAIYELKIVGVKREHSEFVPGEEP